MVLGTSLVGQWLRICLSIQGTQVPSLVREDSTGHRATKQVHHNDCTHVPRACAPRQEKPRVHTLRLESSPHLLLPLLLLLSLFSRV